MKSLFALLLAITLTSCANFDVVPTASFDPATGAWSFSAKAVQTPIRPTK